MNKKAFIITIDPNVLETAAFKKFHATLIADSSVLSWWHYLSNVYIIIVNPTFQSKGISEWVQRQLPNQMFFVAEIKLSTRQGWLPDKAWEWINKWISSTENIGPLLF
jgi:hypothetical protein